MKHVYTCLVLLFIILWPFGEVRAQLSGENIYYKNGLTIMESVLRGGESQYCIVESMNPLSTGFFEANKDSLGLTQVGGNITAVNYEPGEATVVSIFGLASNGSSLMTIAMVNHALTERITEERTRSDGTLEIVNRTRNRTIPLVLYGEVQRSGLFIMTRYYLNQTFAKGAAKASIRDGNIVSSGSVVTNMSGAVGMAEGINGTLEEGGNTLGVDTADWWIPSSPSDNPPAEALIPLLVNISGLSKNSTPFYKPYGASYLIQKGGEIYGIEADGKIMHIRRIAGEAYAVRTDAYIHAPGGEPDLTSSSASFTSVPTVWYRGGPPVDGGIPLAHSTAYVRPLRIALGAGNFEYFGGATPDQYCIRISSGPENGTISDIENGDNDFGFTYTPDSAFWGEDHIEVQMFACSSPGVVQQTFSITVTVPMPQIFDEDHIMCIEDTLAFCDAIYTVDSVGHRESVTYDLYGDPDVARWCILDLDTFPRFRNHTVQSICYGDTFYYAVEHLDTSFYQDLLHEQDVHESFLIIKYDANGCEEHHSFDLTFLRPDSELEVDRTVEEGDTVKVEYGDTTYAFVPTESKSYPIQLDDDKTDNNCISVIIVNVTLIPAGSGVTTIYHCPGEIDDYKDYNTGETVIVDDTHLGQVGKDTFVNFVYIYSESIDTIFYLHPGIDQVLWGNNLNYNIKYDGPNPYVIKSTRKPDCDSLLIYFSVRELPRKRIDICHNFIEEPIYQYGDLSFITSGIDSTIIDNTRVIVHVRAFNGDGVVTNDDITLPNANCVAYLGNTQREIMNNEILDSIYWPINSSTCRQDLQTVRIHYGDSLPVSSLEHIEKCGDYIDYEGNRYFEAGEKILATNASCYPLNGSAPTIGFRHFSSGEELFYTIECFGCEDVLVIHDVPDNELPAVTKSLAICEGDSVLIGDQVIRHEGTIGPTRVSSGSSACDTMITYHVSFRPKPTRTINRYLYNSLPPCAAGLSAAELAEVSAEVSRASHSTIDHTTGCNDTIYDTVFVNGAMSCISDTVVICNGLASYTYNGFRTVSGFGTHRIFSLPPEQWASSPSVQVVFLTLLDGRSHGAGLIEDTVCPGTASYQSGPFSIDPRNYAEGAVVTDQKILHNSSGCDSVVNLRLHIKSQINHHYDTICQHESIDFFGQPASTTGDHERIIQSGGDPCGRIEILHLIKYNNSPGSSESVPVNDCILLGTSAPPPIISYPWRGQMLTRLDTYYDYEINHAQRTCTVHRITLYETTDNCTEDAFGSACRGECYTYPPNNRCYPPRTEPYRIPSSNKIVLLHVRESMDEGCPQCEEIGLEEEDDECCKWLDADGEPLEQTTIKLCEDEEAEYTRVCSKDGNIVSMETFKSDPEACDFDIEIVPSKNPKCKNEIIELTVNVTGSPARSNQDDGDYTYKWSNGQTGATIEVSDIATYSVSVTKQGECDVSKTASVAITESDDDRCKLIKDAYWCDESGARTNKLPCGETTLRMCVEFNDVANGENVQIIATTGSFGPELYSASTTAMPGKRTFSFELTGALFAMGGSENQQDWFIKIKHDDMIESYPESSSDYMKLNIVRFIPEIMDANNMPNGATLMRKWFKGTGSVETISLDWLLSATRYNNKFIETKLPNVYFGPNNSVIQNTLISEIQKLVAGGYVTAPTEIDDEVMVDATTGDATFWQEFYYQRNGYPSNTEVLSLTYSLFDPLDDHLASIGRCSFRIMPKGILKKVSATTYQFTLTNIGIYMFDSFDFEDFQPLGSWNPSTNGVAKAQFGSNWYSVSNKDFRNWQSHHGQGENFLLFSEIRICTAMGTTQSFIIN